MGIVCDQYVGDINVGAWVSGRSGGRWWRQWSQGGGAQLWRVARDYGCDGGGEDGSSVGQRSWEW